ncbi:RHS repeat-associated protein, partial [Clostridium pascui]|uniref:RHS repeat-associated core domain-containing protein n=1 Tax=Clostridium pascui TaxID=46609 RepID=UPI001FB018E1
YYTYDSDGSLVSMNLNGVEYYYIRNLQGDIIGLFDKNGTQVVSYTYDTWGKHDGKAELKDENGTVIQQGDIKGTLASTVGVKNPYRYRAYRFDTETGLYYLNSRYYNPEMGRFINADGLIGSPGELLSYNMFAYCSNNPVNMEDPSGLLFNNVTNKINSYMYKAKLALMATIATVMYNNIVQQKEYINNAIDSISNTISNAVNNTIAKIKTHGNSKQSKKSQHGYEIYRKNTGDVVKVGISGGKVRLDGKSYRAEKQVRDFNKQDGGDIYASRIMGYFPDRPSALEWEWLNAQFRYSQGHSMDHHLRPGFDNWWDLK